MTQYRRHCEECLTSYEEPVENGLQSNTRIIFLKHHLLSIEPWSVYFRNVFSSFHPNPTPNYESKMFILESSGFLDNWIVYKSRRTPIWKKIIKSNLEADDAYHSDYAYKKKAYRRRSEDFPAWWRKDIYSLMSLSTSPPCLVHP